LTTAGKLKAVSLAPEVMRVRKAAVGRIVEAGPFDNQTLGERANAALPRELSNYLISAAIRGIVAVEPDEVSRVEFLGIVSLFMGAKLVAFRKGMAQYADLLAAQLDVRLNARVTSVRQHDDGATVTWVERDGEHTETVPRAEHPYLGGFACDHNKAPGRAPAGKGLLSLTLTNDWCEKHWHDDDQLSKASVEAAETVIPGVAGKVEFVELSRWEQQYSPVGHYAQLGAYRARTKRLEKTVHLCGEYLAAPNLSAATASGESAAKALAAELS
jgi:protoporphyrinogen/coproporphyrinogen III oxidase